MLRRIEGAGVTDAEGYGAFEIGGVWWLKIYVGKLNGSCGLTNHNLYSDFDTKDCSTKTAK
jgi:hypothetical protein